MIDFSFSFKIILKCLVLIYSQKKNTRNTFKAYIPSYDKEEYIYIKEKYTIYAQLLFKIT
jgi:hypothetical protein